MSLQATYAEEALIGACLYRPEILATLEVEAEDFADMRNRAIFASLRAVQEKHGAADAVMLEAELERRGVLEQVGGTARLGDLALSVPTADNAAHYAAEIRRKRVVRDVLEAAERIRNLAGQLDGEELLGEAQRMLSLVGLPEKNRVSTVADLADEEIRAMARDLRAKEAGEDIRPGLPTGLSKLDAKTGGLPLGLVSLVAARPGKGKSTFALQVARNVVAAGLGDAVILSYEDPGRTFALRTLAHEAEIDSERLNARDMRKGDLSRLLSALERIKGSQRGLRIVRAHGLPVARALRLGAALGEEKPVKLVVVDYMQNAARPRPGVKKHEAIEEAMIDAQEVAAKQGIAVLCISQLGRDVERRGDEPRFSDLKDGGALEQCSKLIIALDDARKESGEVVEGLTRALVLKHNNGAGHVAVTLRFDGPHSRFSEAH